MYTHFLSHERARGDVLNLLDAPAVALPQLVQVLQVLVSQIEFDLLIHVEIGEGVR